MTWGDQNSVHRESSLTTEKQTNATSHNRCLRLCGFILSGLGCQRGQQQPPDARASRAQRPGGPALEWRRGGHRETGSVSPPSCTCMRACVCARAPAPECTSTRARGGARVSACTHACADRACTRVCPCVSPRVCLQQRVHVCVCAHTGRGKVVRIVMETLTNTSMLAGSAAHRNLL